MITENSRLTFGKHKGKKISTCPVGYLKWMADNLVDTDFHEYAIVARRIAKKREKEDIRTMNLEKAGDEFLKQHGIDPRGLPLE